MYLVLLIVVPLALLSGALFIWGFVEYKSFSTYTEGKPIFPYDNDRKALLIIDVQKAITGEIGTFMDLDRNMIESIIPGINSMIMQAQSSKMEIIYIRHAFKKYSFLNIFTKGVMEEGSQGTLMDSRIQVVNDNEFLKYKMDAFSNPELSRFLTERKIGKLYITGLDVTMCVDRTIKGARQRGYEVTIVKDLLATKNQETLSLAIEKFKNASLPLISSNTFAAQ